MVGSWGGRSWERSVLRVAGPGGGLVRRVVGPGGGLCCSVLLGVARFLGLEGKVLFGCPVFGTSVRKLPVLVSGTWVVCLLGVAR